MADRPTAWRIDAAARSRDLRALANDPEYKLDEPTRVTLQQALDGVDAALLPPSTRSPTDWVRGDTIEWVWEQLHHVETELVPHTPEYRRANLLAAVEAHLRDDPPKDTVGKKMADTLVATGKTEDLDTVLVQAEYLIRDAHASSTGRHIATRSLRNRLLSLSAAAFAASGALLFAQALMTNTIVPRPVNVTVPGTGLVALVQLGGLLGGLLTAVQVLTAKRSSVFDPAAARAIFRVAFGAIAGLLGVLLVDSGWVTTGAISSLPGMMLLAVAFGASQEAVTRVIERKAQAMQDAKASARASRRND